MESSKQGTKKNSIDNQLLQEYGLPVVSVSGISTLD